MFGSNCCFLADIQVSQETGKVVWYSHLFKNFPVCCDPHNQRCLCSQRNRSRCFSELPYFICDSMSLISGSSAFSKPSLYIRKFLVHVLLKPSLKDFEHNLTNIQNEWNCMVVWTFFGCLPLWLEWKLTFSSPVPLLSFSNLLTSFFGVVLRRSCRSS